MRVTRRASAKASAAAASAAPAPSRPPLARSADGQGPEHGGLAVHPTEIGRNRRGRHHDDGGNLSREGGKRRVSGKMSGGARGAARGAMSGGAGGVRRRACARRGMPHHAARPRDGRPGLAGCGFCEPFSGALVSWARRRRRQLTRVRVTVRGRPELNPRRGRSRRRRPSLPPSTPPLPRGNERRSGEGETRERTGARRPRAYRLRETAAGQLSSQPSLALLLPSCGNQERFRMSW